MINTFFPSSPVRSWIPLKVPLCQDPRLMRLGHLKRELILRNLDSNGTKGVLTARLLFALVEEGLQNIPDPLLMDDRQPEKWVLIANKFSRLVREQEPDGIVRMNIMTKVNEVLDTIKTSREDLMAIATGQRDISEFNSQLISSPLHQNVARFASPLMIEPVVEAELCREYQQILPNAHRMITSSRTMFNMRIGALGIPPHLTISFAEEAELKGKRKADTFRSKRSRESDDMAVPLKRSTGERLYATLGEEVSLDIDQTRTLPVRVVRIEHNLSESGETAEQIVVVKPVSAQYAGGHMEYHLSADEFLAARRLYTDDLNEHLRKLE